MLAVKGAVLLDGIVGEMDHLIADIVEIEFIGGCAYVALAEPVCSHDAVQSSDEHVVADIELPAFVKQRIFNVLLNDVRLIVAIVMFLLLFEDVVQLVDLFNHHYAIASVR